MRVREVEDAVAQRLGDLERRAVESGEALEELLARMGELAQATTVLGRATGGGGANPPAGGRTPPRR